MHRFFFLLPLHFPSSMSIPFLQYFYLFFLQLPLNLSAFFPSLCFPIHLQYQPPFPFLFHSPLLLPQYKGRTSRSPFSQNCRSRYCSPITNTITAPRIAAGGTETCCLIEEFNFLPFPGWDTRQTSSHVRWRRHDKLNICFGFQEFSIISRSDDKIRTL